MAALLQSTLFNIIYCINLLYCSPTMYRCVCNSLRNSGGRDRTIWLVCIYLMINCCPIVRSLWILLALL